MSQFCREMSVRQNTSNMAMQYVYINLVFCPRKRTKYSLACVATIPYRVDICTDFKDIPCFGVANPFIHNNFNTDRRENGQCCVKYKRLLLPFYTQYN